MGQFDMIGDRKRDAGARRICTDELRWSVRVVRIGAAKERREQRKCRMIDRW